MYADFFGLRELPFNNTPDPRFFYPTPDHEEALASLIYAVQERKGFVLLTGEVGTGKTLVSRMMLRHFGTRIAFANLHHALHDAGDLMESVCTEFDLPVETGSTPAKLVRTLHDYLLERFAQDVAVVLVLDEAQSLPEDAFEQLRTIGNLEADDAKLLQIVIVGQPELRQRFASASLRQLKQRIFRSFHLPALNRPATEGYIRHRLALVGAAEQDIFDPVAIESVFEHTQGLPRLINTLCDNAMLSAYSADRRCIDGSFLLSVVEQMMTLNDAPESFGAPAASFAAARKNAPVESMIRDEPPPPEQDGKHRHRLAASRSRELLESLARNVSTLEARLDRPRGVAAGGSVAHRLPGTTQLTSSAAQSLLERAETASLELARREAGIRKLSVTVQAIVGEVRRAFEGLKSMHAQADLVRGRLHELCDRLAARTVYAQASIAHSSPYGMVKESSKPATVVSTPPSSNPLADPHVGSIEGLFRGVRAGLSDLRSLARSDNRLSVVAPFDSAGVHGTRPPYADQPTSRLAAEIEGLLAVVEADEVSALATRR